MSDEPALTPDLQALIVARVAAGSRFDKAVMAAVPDHPDARLLWKRWDFRARKGHEPYATLVRTMRAARAALLEGQVQKIAGADDWRAAAWLLERFDKTRFALTNKVLVETHTRDALQAALRRLKDALPRDEYTRVLRILAAPSGGPEGTAGVGDDTDASH